MKIIETVDEFRQAYALAKKPLGLAPTMGFLHEGHLSLVKRAREDNATVAVSIFVNPSQFGPNEDYGAYPRDMESDLRKLEEAGVDLVFAPDAAEMYPDGFDTYVDVGSIAERLEGGHRPGHFRGVATVVCKLLTIVRPDRVYFGQKDAQQCLVIKRLSRDLNLGAEVIVCPTVREADGLAMSSRNVNLNAEEREAARVLFKSLQLAEYMFFSGIKDANELRRQMRHTIEEEPLAKIDYVSVADGDTLRELDVAASPALVSVAVNFGKTRLIDNITL
ncbi:MAG: pantoate--beta-alanine ligase [Chloroflexi bacterium]|nr:pantoate--beta-alanine ligase [Chloroflexota bacterium]